MMAARRSDTVDFTGGLRGELLRDEPMSRHTSWRVGGRADYFYTPADREDLVQVLGQLPADFPVYWVGLGSNLLVRDGGVAGLVIRTSRGLTGMALESSRILWAEAGVACAQVARFAVSSGLSGAEFLAGVPGSFGGALAMNAGAFGGETWSLVESVECIDRQGGIETLRAADIEVGYRHVGLPTDRWLIAGRLKLAPLEGGDGRARIRSLLERRSATQPVQSANAGSVFRNPTGNYAARLLEQAGLKGARIGDAVLSEVHANFIVNEGQASAADIEALIDLARETVFRETGIELVPEVRIVGRST